MLADNHVRLLEKLEEMVDLRHVERTRELQRRAFAFEPVDHVPTLIDYEVPEEEWPRYGFAEIFADPEKMLVSELSSVYVGARLQDDRLYGIRANYGTGIIASLFGCEVRSFEHSLPTALSIPPDRRRALIEAGVPALRGGIMGRALETLVFFRETLRPYPKLRQVVGSSLLDIQGPFDNASLVWGSDIYYDFFDAPEQVRDLLRIIADTISAVVHEHRRIDGCPVREDFGTWVHLGGICIRNDSSINLSGEQYVTHVKPHDARLLEEFAGSIHFCGRAHQWWKELLDLPGLKGINPYQGEFYDLRAMYDTCESARIPIYQWTRPLDAPCRERIRTGFSRIMSAPDFDSARHLIDRLHKTGHADG
jgi:hypothetical protein